MNETFWKPRLVGARFSEHSIPLEMLKDISALEQMLIEVAKWHFKEENPSYQRAPRGFTQNISFHLIGVEKGSAIPNIALSFSGDLFSPGNAVYFEQAKNSVIAAVAAVEKGLQPLLPKHLLSYFDKFGRNLQDDEYIELDSNTASPVCLTPTIRRRLVKASNSGVITENRILRGRIFSADIDNNTFGFDSNCGLRLRGNIESQHIDGIVEALKKSREGYKFLIQADVETDLHTRKQAIVSVEHISLLDKLDIGTRIDELLHLKEFWLDGFHGKVLDPSTCKDLIAGFDRFFDKQLPLPYVFPTPEGGLSIEWDIGDTGLILELSLKDLTADYQVISDDFEESCGTLNLSLESQKNQWSELNKLLGLITQGADFS